MTRFACFEGKFLAADINKEDALKFIWPRYIVTFRVIATRLDEEFAQRWFKRHVRCFNIS